LWTTPLQQRNCKLLYPGWATNEKAAYQCCLGAMSPKTLTLSAVDQARHVVRHCPGKAIGSTEIVQLRKQRVRDKLSQASAVVAAETEVAPVAAAEASGGATVAAAAAAAAARGIEEAAIIDSSTPVVAEDHHEIAKELDTAGSVAWGGAGVALATGQLEIAAPLAIGALGADLGSLIADVY